MAVQTDPTVIGDFNSAFLPPEMSAPIFERAANVSAVMALATQVPLGINGKNIPVVTGRATASWVSEGGKKPTTKTGISLKTMVPKKLAVISVTSKEVVRANPGNYMTILKDQIGESFALAFDAATMHGTNTPFGQYLDQTTKAVEVGAHSAAQGGTYQDLVSALNLIVTDTSAVSGGASTFRRKLTGFAFDTSVEPRLLESVDLNGRPIWVDMPNTDTASPVVQGRALGRRSVMVDGVATDDLDTVVGYAGDWTQAVWGVTSGITYRTSDQATVTIDGELVSLFENNLIAILAEAEYGFLVNDLKSFVRFTNLVGS